MFFDKYKDTRLKVQKLEKFDENRLFIGNIVKY